MTADDLSAPLGQKASKKKRFVLPIAAPEAMMGGVGLFVVAVFVGWALFANDPFGGEPMVVVPTATSSANSDAQAARSDAPSVAGQGPNRYDGPIPGKATPLNPAPGAQTTVTIIDGTSGKRQEVEVPGPQQDIRQSATVESRLLDTSRHGAIPKIGADGVRPAEAYARAANLPAGKPDSPRIAIVIGGLGIGATNTTAALAKLPGAITLAFSPYGAGVERQVARARADGHEVLLQAPMEPFDYPDNDPGPQTLLTSLLPDQNLDRLHWLMSRFQGYVGVVSLMGARFTASERMLTPVLYEIAKRGLIYLDDGASPRSLASQIAGASGLPFAKAEVVLDAVPTPAHIDQALARLEAIARERGVAVGIATALPATVDRIAQWAKAAESRGLVLVPITAAVLKPKAG